MSVGRAAKVAPVMGYWQNDILLSTAELQLAHSPLGGSPTWPDSDAMAPRL